MPSGFLANLNNSVCCAFRSSIGSQTTRSRNSTKLLFKQGTFTLEKFSGLRFSSLCTQTGVHLVANFSTLTSLKSNCQFTNRRIHLVVAGVTVLSQRKFASTWQPSEHQRNCQYRTSMATSGSKTAPGDLIVDNIISSGNVSNFVERTGVYFKDRKLHNCKNASIGLRNQETFNRCGTSAASTFHIYQRSGNSSSPARPWFKSLHTSLSPRCSDSAVPEKSVDWLPCDEQPTNFAVSIDQNILGDRTLKLQSGSCYLPHPDKEKTGGEDAHFICEEEQALGIADGVGGWAGVGVNAGEYARELMSNSVLAIQDQPKELIDPARVLEKAYSITKTQGSSTACIICLTDQVLHAINLGDSGFIVVRDGCTIFQSPVQQHGFNFTYQLESGDKADLPSYGQVFKVPVLPGDVVVAGTDGLFDNLYNNEITAVLVHAVRAGLAPQVTAQKIAALAHQRALDGDRPTPFSTAAQEAGFRYYGGKLDDTTVIVSYIISSSNI
ncbi:Phosphoprotein phosphatase [Bertholletia excelsa]